MQPLDAKIKRVRAWDKRDRAWERNFFQTQTLSRFWVSPNVQLQALIVICHYRVISCMMIPVTTR